MTNIIKGELSVEKGLGLPIMTTSDRLAYTPPTNGYVVFDTSLVELFYWVGEWKSMFTLKRLEKDVVYGVEDYPFTWIDNTLYTTDKGDIFTTTEEFFIPTYNDYNGVTTINLNTQSLTTEFNNTLLNKFHNLINLDISNNSITVLNISTNKALVTLTADNNLLTNLDINANIELKNIKTDNNQLDEFVNSQMLVDLDTNGLTNGTFESTIFGGNSLTTAGSTAETNLLSKGWVINWI